MNYYSALFENNVFYGTTRDHFLFLNYHSIILLTGSITLFVECYVALTKIIPGNLSYRNLNISYVYTTYSSLLLFISGF